MKNLSLAFLVTLLCSPFLYAQETETLTTKEKTAKRPSSYYGSVTNKFTIINGEYANIAEVYGGWVFNRKWMVGLGAAALTNNINVPDRFSSDPGERLSYMYAQGGIVAEYIPRTDKKFHLVYHLFSGVGLATQYERSDYMDDFFEDVFDDDDDDDDDERNLFFVAEPGVQLEINVLKWLRVAPGITYRATIGSDGLGLTNSDLSNVSFNLGLKIGKF
jgi:hypothetical protein